MRWLIATGSSMESGAFQIHDELVRTSLYKRASHRVVIQLKGRVAHHGGTVRAFWLFIGSVALGLGLAVVWSPSFVDQTIGENGATTILGYSVTATPITGVLMAIGFAFVSGLTGTFTACNVAGLSAIAPLSAGPRPSPPSAGSSLRWLGPCPRRVARLFWAAPGPFGS